MISKLKTPVIHFVIRHTRMVSALENFIAPVTELIIEIKGAVKNSLEETLRV